MCVDVYKALDKREALCPNLCNGSLHLNSVGTVHLGKEVGFYMNCKNGMIAFGNVAHFAHIVNLCRVIILEIGRVVDVSELIGIGKSQLNLQFMMKFYLFHFPKIFLSVDNAVAERTSVRCSFSVAIFAFFPDIYKYFPLDLNDFFEYMDAAL